MNTFSLCITTYNRLDLTLKSFSKVIDDDRIVEVIIVDDCSDNDIFVALAEAVNEIPKVRLFRNLYNIGMAKNKAISVSYATSDYCILLDSDNEIDIDYLDNLLQYSYVDNRIICPDQALPNFIFTDYSDVSYSDLNIKEYIDQPLFDVHLNCCNYVVPREEYLRIYAIDETVKEVDTLFYSYLWLKAGNSFLISKDLKYGHLVHKNSGWLENAQYNMQKAEEIKELIRNL